MRPEDVTPFVIGPMSMRPSLTDGRFVVVSLRTKSHGVISARMCYRKGLRVLGHYLLLWLWVKIRLGKPVSAEPIVRNAVRWSGLMEKHGLEPWPARY